MDWKVRPNLESVKKTVAGAQTIYAVIPSMSLTCSSIFLHLLATEREVHLLRKSHAGKWKVRNRNASSFVHSIQVCWLTSLYHSSRKPDDQNTRFYYWCVPPRCDIKIAQKNPKNWDLHHKHWSVRNCIDTSFHHFPMLYFKIEK